MKSQWWNVGCGIALVSILGCGRTVEGVDPVEGAGGSQPSEVSGGGSTAPCASLGLEPQAPLLVASSGSELWLVRANGELSQLDHGFGAELGPGAPITIEWVKIAGDYALVSAEVGEVTSYLPPRELALFSRDGRRLWRYQQQNPGSSMIYDVMLNGRGFVTFHESALDFGEGLVLMLPTGDRFLDAGSTPLSTPDAQGFIPVARGDLSAPPTELYSYGFVHSRSGVYTPARYEPLPGIARPITALRHFGSSLLYVTRQGSTPLTVFENWQGAESFEIPSVGDEDASESLFGVHVGERWALVTENGRPVLRLDLAAKQAFAVDASALVVDVSYAFVQVGGDRFVAQDAGEILWRLDATTGQFLPLDFGPTLRPLDASYCAHRFTVARDGRLALPLRDEASEGFFLESRVGGEWTRLGMPFLGVAFADAQELREGWLISADDGRDTYCPGSVWPSGTVPPPRGTLVGDSLQVVLPGRGLARAVPGGLDALASVHSSGLCLALYQGMDFALYDPVSDTSEIVFSSSAELHGWNTPNAFF